MLASSDSSIANNFKESFLLVLSLFLFLAKVLNECKLISPIIFEFFFSDKIFKISWDNLGSILSKRFSFSNFFILLYNKSMASL